MARTPLPETLKYLEPFRKQTAKLRPEEIDESMDLSLLNGLLLERIHSVPLAKGKEMLQKDQAILDEWLTSPNLNDNGGMFFLKGYLLALPDLVDRLLEEKDRPQEDLEEIEMEIPSEAKVKKRLSGGGGWQVNWKRASFFIFPDIKSLNEGRIKEFHADSGSPAIKKTVTQVVFGKVAGYKCLSDASMIETMSVKYALDVPGGYAYASLLKSGNRIDAEKFKKYELEFEKYLHTIRIVRVKR